MTQPTLRNPLAVVRTFQCGFNGAFLVRLRAQVPLYFDFDASKDVTMHRLLFVAFLWAWLLTGTVWSQEFVQPPTAEQLIAGIPVMSSDNPEMNRIRMTFRQRQAGSAINVKAIVDWSRDNNKGILVTAGENDTPVVFISEKQSIEFDAIRRKLILKSKANSGLSLKLEGGQIKTEIGINAGKSEIPMDVDLAAFLRPPYQELKLDQTESGDWQVTIISPSGVSQATAIFDRRPPYPIRQLAITHRKANYVIFQVSDIVINDHDLAPWPAFPPIAALPPGLEIVYDNLTPLENEKLNTEVVANALNWAAQGALIDEEARKHEKLSDIDWDALRKTNEEFGPSLRYVLGF